MNCLLVPLLCLTIMGCASAVQTPSCEVDPRYSMAIEYLLADSARYQTDTTRATTYISGIYVADTLVCAALDLFFRDVFVMGYGEYSRYNPHILPAMKADRERFARCRALLCPGLKRLSNNRGGNVTVFLSQVMEEVIPGKDAVILTAVPNLPGRVGYYEFATSMLYTSYEYLMMFDKQKNLDTVIIKKVHR